MQRDVRSRPKPPSRDYLMHPPHPAIQTEWPGPTDGLRIVYRGNFIPPHSTENAIAWGLRGLGHQVIQVQEVAYEPGNPYGIEHTWEQTAEAVRTLQPDVFAWTATIHEDFEGGFLALKDIKAQGVPSATIHLDLYVGLDREVYLDVDPFWSTDFCFTADGGHQDVFAAKGINHHWSLPGVDKRTATIGQREESYNGDVGFAGSYAYHAEWPHRPALIDHLEQRHRRYKHFGGGKGPPVRMQELSNAVASVKVWVGDSLVLPGHGYFVSDRCYELLGRGACLIHPRVQGWDDFSEAELAFYDFWDFDGLDATIGDLLADPARRQALQVAGRARALRDYTWEKRLERVLAIIGGAEDTLTPKVPA